MKRLILPALCFTGVLTLSSVWAAPESVTQDSNALSQIPPPADVGQQTGRHSGLFGTDEPGNRHGLSDEPDPAAQPDAAQPQDAQTSTDVTQPAPGPADSAATSQPVATDSMTATGHGG